jgi:hypothetical protein
MSFKHGDFATLNDENATIEEPVVIDEALDDSCYAVRFLDDNEVFTVHESELS